MILVSISTLVLTLNRLALLLFVNLNTYCLFSGVWTLIIFFTAWKVSIFGNNSGSYFPSFGLNTERYSVSICIQFKCGKIRTRITPNTDTFYGVVVCWKRFEEAYLWISKFISCYREHHFTQSDDKVLRNLPQDRNFAW